MLNIIKLAVGCPSIEVLRERLNHYRINGRATVQTRTMPKRAEEVLDGGSLHRVLDGMVPCR